MTSPEDTSVSPALISRSALVSGCNHSLPELGRDLRAIAARAAGDWSQAATTVNAKRDPAEFGAQVAQVYLAALRELNAGFAPDTEFPEGRG